MKIAIARLSSLGDIVQTLVVVQYIRRNFPSASIDWYVDASLSEILETNNDLDNIIPLNIRNSKNILVTYFSLFLFLRKSKIYDFVIDYQGLLKSALIAGFLNSKKTYGFSYKSCREAFASFFYDERIKIPYSENIYKRYIYLTNKALNINISLNDLYHKDIFLHVSGKTYVAKKSKILIGYFVGASRKDKIYPHSLFIDVMNFLDYDFVLYWGSDKEHQIAKEIISGSKRNNAYISEKLSLTKLVKAISSVDIFIGGDTGISYIAWAMNIPTITLFGPTNSSRITLPSNRNIVIDAQTVNPNINAKMSDIPPREIIKNIKVILSSL